MKAKSCFVGFVDRKLYDRIVKERPYLLQQISMPRHNYRPQTVNFFKKVFARDVVEHGAKSK